MIYLFDRRETLIKIVSKGAVKTALQTFALTTDKYVSDRLTVEMRALSDPDLERVEYMAIQSLDDTHNFHFFYVAQKQTEGKTTELIGVQSGIEELRKTPVYDKRPQNALAREVIADLLTGTNWSARFVGESLPRSTNFYYTSVFDALKKVCQVWDLEMQFFVQMNGNEIGARVIDFKKKIGEAVGKRVVYGHNALQILQEVERTNLYTALIGRGKGEQVSSAGEDGRQADGYGRKINFEDVVWRRSAGDPVNKPKGQAYVEIPAMTAQYGIRQANGSMKPKIGFIDFSEEEDKSSLLQRTYEALVDASRPQVTFKTSAVYLKGVAIGDTIRVVRHDKRLDYDTRIFELTVNRLDNQSSNIKLGDRITDSQYSRVQSIADQAVEKFVQNEFNNFVQNLPDFLPSADGFNNNWYGAEDPTVAYKGKVVINDIWYKPDPEHEGHKIMLRWTGEAWEELVRTYDTEAVRRQVEAVQAKANQVAEQARQSDQKADQALTKAGASENLAQTAKDTADRAIRQAGDNLRTAQNRADQLQTELSTAKQSITSQAKDILNQAKAQSDLTRKVQTVETTANGTKTTVTELTKTVNANTGNLTSVTQRVATAENTLTNVRNQYSTLKTTVDDQSGKVTSLERQTADLSSGLDGVKERFEKIKIGASNLILAKVAEDGFLNTSGNVQRASNVNKERTSGFIPVEPNEELMFQVWATVPDGQALWRAWQFYDANQRPIGSRQVPTGAWAARPGKQQSQDLIQVPVGAAFIRVTARQYEDGKMQLERGNVPTDYSPAEEDFRQEFAEYKRDASQNLSALSRIVTSPEGLLKQTESKVNQMADRLEREFNTTLSDSLAGKLRQASAKIDETAEALTSKLSAADFKPFFDKKGIAAGANLAETFENWEVKTAQSIEQQLTATRALIPTEFSGNILKDGKQTWRNSRGATYTLDDDLEPGREYTLTIRYWNGTGGQAVSTNLFGSWQVGVYDSAVDAWVIRGQSSIKQTKGYTFAINAHPGTGLGNADWATLTKGPLAMSRYQEPFSSFVTSVDFQKVQETAQLYERILGKTEGDVTTNIARQVMTSELYQTEVTKARDNQANLLVGTEQTKELIFDRPNTSNFQVHTLFGLLGNRSFAQYGFKIGDSVTLSFDYEVTDNNFRRIVFNNFRIEGYALGYIFPMGSVTSARSGTYQATFTFSTQEQLAAYQFSMRADAPSLNCKLVVKNCRLNRGSVAYPWQAHFEDLSAQATRVTQLADSYAIKTLGSAGQVLSAINLATGGASIQVGQNKLVVTPETTFIQNGTIKSAMIESMDAGKITTGEFDAAKARIINLDVNSVNGLNAEFIKAKIELALVDWLRGKVITAQNDAMAINLNQADVTFRHNATINFESENNAIVRRKNDVTGFMSFSDDTANGGVYGVFGVSSNNTGIVTSRQSDGGTFAGLRVYRPGPHLDMVQLVGDKIQLRHSTGDGGHYFEFRPTTLNSNIDMNTMINGIKALAMCFKHIVANNFDFGQSSLRNAITREVTNYLDATAPHSKIR